MTSSLVGSEMCIRDSCLIVDVAHLAVAHACMCAPGQGRRHRGGCAWSVSYTHLTLPTICSV
eukprot:11718952-Prorocentrum_lima.AAC.1